MRVAIVAGALAVMLAAPPAWAEEPSPAMKAQLEANGVEAYGIDAEPVNAFPNVVFVVRNIPDAGPFFVGAFVGGKWVGGKSSASWPAVSTAAMRMLGWHRLHARRREALALKWVTEAEPPGATTQTLPSSPDAEEAVARMPKVRTVFAEVVVTAWITRTHQTVAGPRSEYPGGPTTFIFSRDGTVRVERP
jgi:hypothetical protein